MSVPAFPTLPGLTYPVGRSHMIDVESEDAVSGARTRYSYQSYPLYKFTLKFEFLRSDQADLEWQQLAGFWNSVYGPTYLFSFDDPNDDNVTMQDFGEGDGATTSFQLVRTLGGFTEPVFLVDPDVVPTIYDAGSPVSDANYTISQYGVVEFNTPPNNGDQLQWTGNFFWPCRFDKGSADFNNFMYQFFELNQVTFTTEKILND